MLSPSGLLLKQAGFKQGWIKGAQVTHLSSPCRELNFSTGTEQVVGKASDAIKNTAIN